MKQKNRLFSLLLAAVLIITTFSFTASADEEDYSDPEIWGDAAQIGTVPEITTPETAVPESEAPEKKEEVQRFNPKYSGVDRVNIYNSKDAQMLFKVLKTLGIMDSYENPEAVLTRGEFAEIVARIMQNGKAETTNSWRYEFKDVDETVKNRAEIIYLANYGIIQGDGQGNFYPDNNIKSTEAVIMLLNMMGYYEVAKLYGEGLNGYMKLASKLDFSSEINVSSSHELTKEDAVKLVYHALHERVVESSLYSGDTVTFETSDETVMYRFMDILTVEGIADANEYTSLYSRSGKVAERSLQIGETIVSFKDSAIEPADYLGLYTRVYFKENEGNYRAVFAECIENKQEILKINANDIESYNSETKMLSYTENNRTETEKIPLDASIIFNGAAVSGTIDARCFTPDAGQLVFIDTDRSGGYDIIMIDSFETYLVKNTIKNDEDILYDDLSVQPMISLSDKEIRVFKDNEQATLSDIQSGSIAMVASEKITYVTSGNVTYAVVDTSSEFYSVLLCNEQVKGTLDSFIEDDKLTIDGTEYKYSSAFLTAAAKGSSNKAADSRVMNVTVTAGLDPDGNIVWMERGTDGSLKYAYLVKIGEGKRSTYPNQVMLFTQDNEMLTLDFAEKVKVFAHWDEGDINTSSYYSKRIERDALIGIDMLYSDGKSKQQLVQYKLDAEGKVALLYIAANDSRDYTTDVPMLYDNVLYKSATVENTYFFNYPDIGGVISPVFEYNKVSTYGFAVPDNPDITDKKYFTAHKNEISLFGNGSNVEKMDLYNVDNGRIGAFVYKQPITVSDGESSVAFDPNGTFSNLVIESARQIRNADDEYVTEITAYHQNVLKNFSFTSGELISHANANIPELNEVKVSELKRGDIILAHFNTFEQIDGFKVVHRVEKAIADAADGNITAYERIWDGSLYTALQPVYPKLFSRGEVVKSIDKTPYVNTGRSDGVLRRIILYGWTNQLIIYDVQNDTMTLTQDSNKRADFSQLQEGDYVFWYQSERAILSVVAIRNYK